MKLSRSCIISLLAVLFFLSAAERSSAGEEHIIIFPFEGTAGADTSEIRDAMPLLVLSRLNVPARLSAHMAESQQKSAGQKDRLLPLQEKLALAKRLGADYCLTGSITKAADSMRMDALLTDLKMEDRQTPLEVQIANKDAIISQIGSLCAQVKKAILAKDAPAPPSAAMPPAAKPRASGEPENRPLPTTSQRKASALEPSATILLAPPVSAAPQENDGAAAQQAPRDLAAPRQARPGSTNPLFEPQAALSYMIKGSALTMLSTGDVNGDGRKELLLAGPETLYIYTIGAGATLSPSENIPVSKTEHLVHIDTGDFNGNGTDEIYVSSYDGKAANSFVLEYRNGSYQRLAEKQPWFFRAYAPAGSPMALIGQAAKVGNPFAGDIMSLHWSGPALTAGEKIKLPVICGIYSFTEAALNNDKYPKFFFFKRGVFQSALKLSVLSPDGKTLWEDTNDLGQTQLFFMRTVSYNQSELKEPIPMRIICSKAVSGQTFMIIGKNAHRGDSFFSFLIKNTQGAACSLVWNGSDFQYNWASDFVKDFISDYILDDVDSDGTAELVVLAVTGDVTGSFALNRIQLFRQR